MLFGADISWSSAEIYPANHLQMEEVDDVDYF